MPNDRLINETEVLEELETLRRQSAERSADIKQLAAAVHGVLGRRAMAGALLRDARDSAADVPSRARRALAVLRRRPPP